MASDQEKSALLVPDQNYGLRLDSYHLLPKQLIETVVGNYFQDPEHQLRSSSLKAEMPNASDFFKLATDERVDKLVIFAGEQPAGVMFVTDDLSAVIDYPQTHSLGIFSDGNNQTLPFLYGDQSTGWDGHYHQLTQMDDQQIDYYNQLLARLTPEGIKLKPQQFTQAKPEFRHRADNLVDQGQVSYLVDCLDLGTVDKPALETAFLAALRRYGSGEERLLLYPASEVQTLQTDGTYQISSLGPAWLPEDDVLGRQYYWLLKVTGETAPRQFGSEHFTCQPLATNQLNTLERSKALASLGAIEAELFGGRQFSGNYQDYKKPDHLPMIYQSPYGLTFSDRQLNALLEASEVDIGIFPYIMSDNQWGGYGAVLKTAGISNAPLTSQLVTDNLNYYPKHSIHVINFGKLAAYRKSLNYQASVDMSRLMVQYLDTNEEGYGYVHTNSINPALMSIFFDAETARRAQRGLPAPSLNEVLVCMQAHSWRVSII